MVRIWEWSMWYCLYFSLNLDVDWFVSCLFSYLLQEHHVKTCHGSVSVVVYGDQEKPALITYPDVALNCKSGEYTFGTWFVFILTSFGNLILDSCMFLWLLDMSCFQGLFLCPEAVSLLLHNFCIYHISPPGHEVCRIDCLETIHYFLCISLAVCSRCVGFHRFHKSFCSLELLQFVPMIRHLLLKTSRTRFLKYWTSLGKSWIMFRLTLTLNLGYHNKSNFRYYPLTIYVSCSLEAVMCMGITAGAYILSLFAVCTHWGLLRIYL